MRPAWVSLYAAAVLAGSGCGSAPSTSWLPVRDSATAAGLEVSLLSTSIDDTPMPWRIPPAGSHCAVYRLQVRTLDGRPHEVRPTDFRSADRSPVEAVGRCNAVQLEPTWVSTDQVVQLTILEDEDVPAPLLWRPR